MVITKMDEKHVANGVLFYCSLYIKCLLLAVTVLTGRWIFLLLILLTMGLTAYMMYVTSHDLDHLKAIGKWADTTISTSLEKIRQMF